MTKFLSSLLISLTVLIAASPAHATLPSGYTELEYIESTGTQYIDTNFVFTGNKGRVDIEYMQTRTQTSSRLFGYWIDYTGDSLALRLDNGFYRLWVGSTELYTDNSIASAINVKHSVSNAFDNGNCTITFDGVEHTNTYEASISQSNRKCYLFAMEYLGNTYGNISAKMYSCKIYDGDTLARNYIPARRNSDNVIGMYDTVSGTFFTNAGTGEFIAGPVAGIAIATTAYNAAAFAPVEQALESAVTTIKDVVANTIVQADAIQNLQDEKQTRPDEDCPAGRLCLLVEDIDGTPHWYPIIERVPGMVPANSGYTQVPYLQSDGNQWIDTGFTANGGMVLDAKVLPINNEMVIGSIGPNNVNPDLTRNMISYTIANGVTAYHPQKLESFVYEYQDSGTSPAIIHMDTTGTKFYCSVDGNSVVDRTTNAPLTNQTTTVKISYSDYSTAARAGRYYYVQIKNSNDTMVFDGVPARRDSDGVLGMYDTISGTFFTNAGTGSFTTETPAE